MQLKAYIHGLTPDQLASFAERCGTTAGQIKQVAGGYRKAGESLAINIDRETGGKVSCDALRPDVDFAYLRNTKTKRSRAA